MSLWLGVYRCSRSSYAQYTFFVLTYIYVVHHNIIRASCVFLFYNDPRIQKALNSSSWIQCRLIQSNFKQLYTNHCQ
uniref:Uncharacterized protein n=1 Tax=Lepeophtheirus salmonis TaxID=72036 RepID=A0A0K2UGB6_LEPSM